MSDKQEVSETLKAAHSYLTRLKNLNNMIQNAERQIQDSSKETERTIETTFSTLLANLTQILLNRKDNLITRVQEVSFVSLEQINKRGFRLGTRV